MNAKSHKTSPADPSPAPERRTLPPHLASKTGVIGLAIAGLAVSALVNHRLAKRAERNNPPQGKFIDMGSVRLHYVERGNGEPVIMLHGNGSMIQDFESSGLLDIAAQDYRVIVPDRPGYGHTNRPRNRIWTPEEQADLIHDALKKLGVERATILGHSWGCSVAIALADKYPKFVRGLVLVSGYYYPTARVDVVAMSGPAVPVAGDLVRYTVAPLMSRLMWPLMLRHMFGPPQVPEKFTGFPKEMAVRPSQLRASAEESGLMIPAAAHYQTDYHALKMPIAIVAGSEDRLIDPEAQSARLHREIVQSSFHSVSGAGHMVHQTATTTVMRAIDEISAL